MVRLILYTQLAAVSLKADRTTAHDRTVRRQRLHAVVRPHNRKQSTGVQSSGPRTRTQVLHARDVLY